MLVGDDVAVGGNDKAGAAGGGLALLAEHVIGGAGGVDGHHAVDGAGVHLGGGHLLAALHLLDGDGHLLGSLGSLVDGGLVGVEGAVHRRAAEAAQAGHQGAHQHQGHRLHPQALLGGGATFHLMRGLRRGGHGAVLIPGRLAPGIVILFEFIVIHMDSSFIFKGHYDKISLTRFILYHEN